MWERDVLTIEEMAVHYATEIKRVQPRGPYSFLGFSFGGILAFAIASRLMRDGQAVAHLVLLDTPAPGLSMSSLRQRATDTVLDIVRGLSRLGVINDAVIRRFGLGTLLRSFRTPLERVTFSFGAGPMTATELRTALSLAFPGYAYRRTRDMSFERLCSVIAEELEGAVTDKQWTRMIRRAGSKRRSV